MSSPLDYNSSSRSEKISAPKAIIIFVVAAGVLWVVGHFLGWTWKTSPAPAEPAPSHETRP
ncbi:MAG: hypothetical protein ABSF56_03145 [Minisyncoccia bacterium]|jgi:hypothetical protein